MCLSHVYVHRSQHWYACHELHRNVGWRTRSSLKTLRRLIPFEILKARCPRLKPQWDHA
ncbi:MAG: hypothetical protein KatS3mg056_2252 [Chloroflexus sp.]|nr:MAG: hypothetical protein KatS3mg056_2252 [Chloroflexus sp.]